MIILILTVLEVTISNVSFVGVRINGITEVKLLTILLAVALYHAIYFTWSSIDEYWKWRLGLIVEATSDYTKRQTDEGTLSQSQAAIDPNLYLREDSLNSLYRQINTAISLSLKKNEVEEVSEIFKNKLESIWMSSMQPVIEQDLARVRKYELSFRSYHWMDVMKLFTLEFGFPLAFSLYAIYQAGLKILL